MCRWIDRYPESLEVSSQLWSVCNGPAEPDPNTTSAPEWPKRPRKCDVDATVLHGCADVFWGLMGTFGDG